MNKVLEQFDYKFLNNNGEPAFAMSKASVEITKRFFIKALEEQEKEIKAEYETIIKEMIGEKIPEHGDNFMLGEENHRDHCITVVKKYKKNFN